MWAKTNYKKRFAAVLLPTRVIRPSHVLLVDQIFISLSDMQISLLFLCNVLNTGFMMDILYIIYVYYIYIIIYNVI